MSGVIQTRLKNMAKSNRNRTPLTRRDAARRRAHIVRIVSALPETKITEHGKHLGLEVRGKPFGWYLDDHHGDGRLAINCKAPPGANQSLALGEPERFHIPKYVGNRGWVGLWLDLPQIDWSEVESVLRIAYSMAAPKSLLNRLSKPSESRRRQ